MIANQIAGFLGGAGAAAVGDYQSISTVTVGSGGSSSIDFTSIPSTYSHLQIRALTRATSTGANASVRLNSDSGANYSFHVLYGDGTSAASAAGTGQTSALVGNTANSGTAANVFSVIVLDILDYANTNKNKTLRSLDGFDANNASPCVLQFNSAGWYSTSAVNAISLIMNSGNFAQYTHVALYGIK
jgi:hypothetical protein